LRVAKQPGEPDCRHIVEEMPSVYVKESTEDHASIAKFKTIWLGVIIVVGATLRLYSLDFQSLWQDEGLQFYVATQNSFSELLHQTRSFHPPLSFIINHVFLLMGESDFFLRLPSALFGIASLPLLYILGRDLTSSREAVLAVFVLAISPFHIWYSQDARMYSQLLFLSLLSTVLLMQALSRGKVRWWVYYILVSAAGMYTHVFMALALTAQFLWLFLYHRRHLLPIVATGVAVAVLFLPWGLYLPWVSNFVVGVSRVGLSAGPASDGRAGFTLAAVPYTFFVYSAGFSLGPTVAELHADKSAGFILSFLPTISVVAVVFTILLGTGIFVMYKRFGLRPCVFSLLGLCLPLAGTLAYALTPHAAFNVRYTIIAFPYFCLFIGTALAYVARTNKFLGVAAVLAVIGISYASIDNHFTNPRYAKEDIRSAVTFWRQAGDEELLLAMGSIYPTHRYVGASDANRLFLIGGENIVPRIEQFFLTQNTSSAYVVLARDWDKARETAIRNAFAGTLERSFPGVKVFRISRPRTLQISDASGKPAASRHR
jgi:4-amino-4-deoxy-L-arabinose transferase-like glycosyltransferase